MKGLDSVKSFLIQEWLTCSTYNLLLRINDCLLNAIKKMSTTMKVPPVGESITEVTVAQWFKKQGDYVEMDEVICELESEKATFELNAETTGVLHPKAKEGDTLEIGAVICEIDTAAKANKQPQQTADTPSAPIQNEKNVGQEAKSREADQPQKTNEVVIKVPTIGESVTEGTIATWHKKEGDLVMLDEVIAEIDSDKATFEIHAEAQGILHIHAQEGDTVEIGGTICTIEVTEGTILQTAPPQREEKSTAEATQQQTMPHQSHVQGSPSPLASKILFERGIDPQSVQGTGVGGRITKNDALKAEKSTPKSLEAIEKTTPDNAVGKLPRNQRREKLSTIRKTIARKLVAAKNETAMLTTFNEVNMEPVMTLRKKYKEAFKEQYEVNLGFMSFFTKAVCMALQAWPTVNARIDGDEMIYHDFCDVAIAVATPYGLVAPVIRNAEGLTFEQIEKEVVRLATKARENKLSIEEMTGGTFTITNGGIFGSMLSTPIINMPQSAILGMHHIVERPVAMNGQVVIKPVMYVALSYDHRLIDGRQSVSFLSRVKELIEDPNRLLLGV